MEQCDLFAVFDGHSGAGIVRHTVEFLPGRIKAALEAGGPDILANPEAIKAALREVFIDHDKDLAKNLSKLGDSGTTATVALITPAHVIVAYIGDSPCFLMNPNLGLILPGGEMGKHEPTLATENARIVRAGGSVEIDEMGVPRVDGLMVSRAFGDFSIKFPDPKSKPYGIKTPPPYDADWTQMKVTAHPDFVVWERPESGLLALMSDGMVETDTTALKPLPQVAADIFKALKDTMYDLPKTATAAVKAHVAASAPHGDYDGDDLSLLIVDVGKGGSSLIGGGSAAAAAAAVTKMTAGKPNTRRQGKKKSRTMKTNRLIKMFTVG
jgi:serine/threonine protein phosphatase PrpC